MPGERGHFVNSGIVTSSKEMLIIDTQLSAEYGRRLGLRAKYLDKHLKAIYISHGHGDHTWGTKDLLKVFLGTPVFASQETINKMIKDSPEWLDPKLFRPFSNNVGAPGKIIIPQLWNESTIELDGELAHLLPPG
jgi:glyoxylase-like metal-dependent hydrolase (beta-lactamase superfamily II)